MKKPVLLDNLTIGPPHLQVLPGLVGTVDAMAWQRRLVEFAAAMQGLHRVVTIFIESDGSIDVSSTEDGT